jgi:hypothetical protein
LSSTGLFTLCLRGGGFAPRHLNRSASRVTLERLKTKTGIEIENNLQEDLTNDATTFRLFLDAQTHFLFDSFIRRLFLFADVFCQCRLIVKCNPIRCSPE